MLGSLIAAGLLVFSKPAKCEQVYVIIPDGYLHSALLLDEIQKDSNPADQTRVISARQLQQKPELRRAIDAGEFIHYQVDDPKMAPETVTTNLSKVIYAQCMSSSAAPAPPPAAAASVAPAVAGPTAAPSASGGGTAPSPTPTDAAAEAEAAPASAASSSLGAPGTPPAAAAPAPSPEPHLPAPQLPSTEPPPTSIEGPSSAPPPRTVGRAFAVGGLTLGIASIAAGAVMFSINGDYCGLGKCLPRYVETGVLVPHDTIPAAAVFTTVGAISITSFGTALLVDELRQRRWRQQRKARARD